MSARTLARLLALRAVAPLTTPRRRRAAPSPQRVLVIRPDHLGDLLFLTPALAFLRRSLPQAEITCLVGPWSQDIVTRNPNVDRVLACEFPWFTRRAKTSALAPYRLLAREARRLRRERFDLALVMRFDFWWGALLSARAGIPVRAGYAVAECAPFLNRRVPYASGRHEVEQNLALVAAALGVSAPEELPALQYPLAKEEDDFAGRFLGAGAPVIALHPGAGAPVKRWRASAFAEVGRTLAAETGASIVVTGGEQESELVAQVMERLDVPARALVGAPLVQVAAVFRRCRLVLGVDSGPLHLAVAAGAPTVHLYGPVDDATFGPWGDAARHAVVKSALPCVPCNRLEWPVEVLPLHPCVASIEVDAVLAAARRVLAATQ